MVPDKAKLDLIEHPAIWRASDLRSARPVLPTGYEELDRALPGGGWPRDAVTEIFLERYGIGELTLLMPALSRVSTTLGKRWIVWVAPPFIPYAPALAQQGIDLDRVLLVHVSAAQRKSLWAVEQALRSKSSVAVLAWVDEADDKALRRLQLAAEARTCWAVLFRPIEALRQRSPAALRLKLSCDGAKLRLELVKCRGRRPGVITLYR